MDIAWGLVYVLGVPHTNIRGPLIGSPIAAGVASLVVAFREEVRRRLTKKKHLCELQMKLLHRCWLDDAIQIQRGCFSPEAEGEVNLTRSEGFYGTTLRLLPVRGNEAFGFLVDADARGRIRVQPKWSFVYKKEEFRQCTEVGLYFHVRPNGGVQYLDVKIERGVILGRHIRVLDTTDMHSDDLELTMKRLTAELAIVGTSRSVGKRASQKTERVAERRWPSALKMVSWGEEARMEWSMSYDEDETARWCVSG